MIVDSHCHLDKLAPYIETGSLEAVVEKARDLGVTHMMCISVDLDNWHAMMAAIEPYEQIYATVGVHPCYRPEQEPTADMLAELAQHPKVIGIGETGLDYFKPEIKAGDSGEDQLDWQRERFRAHIRAAKQSGQPLIIHTREAREDTVRILREEDADQVGGIIHCFAEDWAMAKACIELGFYISFSGIVTFNSAKQLQAVAQKMPQERILIETDSPWLAPVPHRGKENQPAYTRYVAEKLAELRGETMEEVAQYTTNNFKQLFKVDF